MNNFETWLKKARSRSPFEDICCKTKFLHFAVENPENLDFFPYHLKVTHYYSSHCKVVRHFFYETLREMKQSAEYLSKYDDVICEVM